MVRITRPTGSGSTSIRFALGLGTSGDFQPDGAGPNDAKAERITSDDWEDWFAHPSPDGKWLVFLSFPPGTPGHDAKLQVQLRMMPMPGAEVGAKPGPIRKSDGVLRRTGNDQCELVRLRTRSDLRMWCTRCCRRNDLPQRTRRARRQLDLSIRPAKKAARRNSVQEPAFQIVFPGMFHRGNHCRLVLVHDIGVRHRDAQTLRSQPSGYVGIDHLLSVGNARVYRGYRGKFSD